MSHHSAPVAVLEKLSMDAQHRVFAATALIEEAPLSEAMIISTCNRMEVYVVAEAFHPGVRAVMDVLVRCSGVNAADLRRYLYVRYADAAAYHAMTVAAGLDSMVVGEQQILGQMRTAYQDAAGAGTVGPALHALAQSALRAGKRVHTETEIDSAGASMVSVALDEACAAMGRADLSGRTAVVLGAGAMSSLAATQLGRLGVERLIVANRTRERAQRLAEHSSQAGVAAEVVDFDARAEAIERADIVVSATASGGFTVTPEVLGTAPGSRVLVDLSLPRDIDDAVDDLPGIHLINIERLSASIGQSVAGPAREAAEAIVAEEMEAYSTDQRVREIAPVVTELRVAASRTADDELSKLRTRLPQLGDDEFAEVTRAMKRVVDKLLHHPTVKIKEIASAGDMEDLETTIGELFGLEDEVVAHRTPTFNFEASQLTGLCDLKRQAPNGE
ncbi:glutamyl-tRNA reductase [Corynebacterium aquatimens]